MKDFSTVGRRLRRFKFIALILFAVAIFVGTIGLLDHINRGPPHRYMGNARYEYVAPSDPYYQEILRDRWREVLYFLYWSAGIGAAGALAFLMAHRVPAKEVLLLAQERGGLLTLGEVTIALDIDPRLASRSLRLLQKLNLATPRWQEIRKNLWEFPDYMKLPIPESLELAKNAGGHLRLEDLLAMGVSADTARQTLDTLTEKGLAQTNPDTPDVIVTAQ